MGMRVRCLGGETERKGRLADAVRVHRGYSRRTARDGVGRGLRTDGESIAWHARRENTSRSSRDRAPAQAFFALPSNIGVTASLDVKYKKPTFANQYVVIRTQVGHVNGRKVRVKGHIEDLEGQTLVEAECVLFAFWSRA